MRTHLHRLTQLHGKTPVLRRTLILLIAVEIVAVAIAPFLTPETIYLKQYLPSAAIDSTERFLDGGSYVIADPEAGWRNKPSTRHKNWVIDRHGSRSSRPATLERSKPKRMMLLGSFMINGGTGVTNNETISAYMENDEIEVLNFGTMLYGLDQSILAFQSRLHRFSPDIVIFGLDSDPLSQLENIYIPFRSRKEINIPLVKPRFELRDGKLHPIKASPDLLTTLFEPKSDFYRITRAHDEYYHRFATHKHLGQTPIANGFRIGLSKLEELDYYLEMDKGKLELLYALMRKAVETTAGHGSKAVFLFMPGRGHIEWRGAKGYFPNRYTRLLEELNQRGFPVVDAREILKSNDAPVHALYSADNLHFSALGNKAVGRALRLILTDPESTISRRLQAAGDSFEHLPVE